MYSNVPSQQTSEKEGENLDALVMTQLGEPRAMDSFGERKGYRGGAGGTQGHSWLKAKNPVNGADVTRPSDASGGRVARGRRGDE